MEVSLLIISWSLHTFCFIYCKSQWPVESFFLGRSLHRAHEAHHGRCRAGKFSKFVSPDALKMYSLAIPVLRFLWKTFSKLDKYTLRNTSLRKETKKKKRTFAWSITYLNEWKHFCRQFSTFASTSFCLVVFLFCLHFCLLSYFEIIRSIVKSLIATSKYFFWKYNWKKSWLVLFGRQSLGAQIGILVSQTTWIRHWVCLFKNGICAVIQDSQTLIIFLICKLEYLQCLLPVCFELLSWTSAYIGQDLQMTGISLVGQK